MVGLASILVVESEMGTFLGVGVFAGLISNPVTLYVPVRYGGNQSRVISTFRCDTHD